MKNKNLLPNLLQINKYPDLLRVFLVVFLAVATITIAVVGFGIYRIYSNYIIDDAENTAVKITEVLIRHSEDLIFSKNSLGAQILSIDKDNFPAMDTLMHAHLQPLDIVKIKVYSPEYKIIYSTDKGIIGLTDADNRELHEALKGNIESELETKGSIWDLEQEEDLGADIIETYVPVKGNNGEVVGVFEIYSDVTKYRSAIFYTFLLSMAVLSGVILVNFIFLFSIIRRATKIADMAAEKEKNLASALAAADMERSKASELESAYNKLKETQEMLIQAEKMVAMGQFASGIAHDLNNPLVGIIGNLDLLAMDKSLSPEINKMLDEIKVQAKRIKVMADNLLSFARKKKSDFTDVDVGKLLTSIQPLLMYSTDFKKITWQERINPGLPVILGDFNRLQEVLVNLSINACQATPRGGTVSLSGELDSASKTVKIKVSDTGIGMDEEQLQKLFDPFFTTKENGTGLGLSICRSIIEEHRGAISVQSVKGEGSVFTIVLPVA